MSIKKILGSSKLSLVTTSPFLIPGGNCNANWEDYVLWCWRGGGAAVSNSDGSITSSVSVNQEAGFSIVSYTGNGSAGATVGHGLG